MLLQRDRDAASSYAGALDIATRSEVDADTRARAVAGLDRTRRGAD